MRSILTSLALATFATGAAAQNVYKYTDPSGHVIYTDDPTAGHGTAKRVEIPAQPAANPAAGLSEAERNLLEQADRRAAELDRATTDIVTAFNALRAAKERKEQGVEPLEGERAGRRYRPEYWARQQALKRNVDDAQAKLDDALARRNALR
jgi:hypothetical protein